MSNRSKSMRMARSLTLSGLQNVEADDRSSLTMNWHKHGESAYQIVSRHQKSIVNRARSEYINNDHLRQYVRDVKSNVSGKDGVTVDFQFRKPDGTLDENINWALRSAWKQFSEKGNFDASGKRNRVQMEHKALHSLAIDGEPMGQLLQSRANGDAGPYGFSINEIDPQRCPVDYDVDRPGSKTQIRHGIEVNQFSRHLKYHISDNEGRTIYDSYHVHTPYAKMKEIPAGQMLHFFVDELPAGQMRGFPLVTSALIRLHMLRKFETAIVTNAALNTTPSGAISMPESWLEESDLSDEEKNDLLNLIEVKLGEYRKLPHGAELLDIPNEFPKNDHGPFMKTVGRGIASGLGDNYNTLFSDGEGINYSTMRHFTLSSREHWACMQDLFITGWVKPIFARWLEYALMNGRIVTKRGRRLNITLKDKILDSTKISGRDWGWVDPEKEEKAASEAQSRMRRAASDIVTNYEEVLDQISDDLKKAQKKTGLAPEIVAALYFGEKDLANVNRNSNPGTEPGQPGQGTDSDPPEANAEGDRETGK